MQRQNIEQLTLSEILAKINKKHGLTKGNSLVAREMTRIYNKHFTRKMVLTIKREAAIRVLCGLNDIKDVDIFTGINSKDI